MACLSYFFLSRLDMKYIENMQNNKKKKKHEIYIVVILKSLQTSYFVYLQYIFYPFCTTIKMSIEIKID